MFFEDVKNAVDKNDWKTLGRDRKGRFTPRGNEDETKISRPNSQRAKSKQVKEKPLKKDEEKKPIKKAKRPVSKKTEEKKTEAKKEEAKKLVKKVKSSYKNNKRNEEERKINPIPKKNEIGTTMCDYLKKFQK